MKPILKDLSGTPDLLSVEELVIKLIDHMQAQKRSSFSENEFNNLVTLDNYLAIHMNEYLEWRPTYVPRSTSNEFFDTDGVEDERLLSLVKKIHEAPQNSTLWETNPITLNDCEEQWLNLLEIPLKKLTDSGTERANFEEVKNTLEAFLNDNIKRGMKISKSEFSIVLDLFNKIKYNLNRPQEWPLTPYDRDYIKACTQIDDTGKHFWESAVPILNDLIGQQGKVVPIFLPVPCGKGILPVYDVTRSMLDNVHLVGCSASLSTRWHSDYIQQGTPSGFATHDIGHGLGASSIMNPIVKQAMIGVLNADQEAGDRETITALFWTLHETSHQGNGKWGASTANIDYFLGCMYRHLVEDLKNEYAVDMKKERIGPLGQTYTLKDILNQKISKRFPVWKERMDEFDDCINPSRYLDDLAQGAQPDDILFRAQMKARRYRIDPKSYAKAIFAPLIKGKDTRLIHKDGEFRNMMKYVYGQSWSEEKNPPRLQEYVIKLQNRVIHHIDQKKNSRPFE